DNGGSIDAHGVIARRNSSTEYKIVTISNGVPTNTSSGDQDWMIFRYYTSLYDAERGSINSGLDPYVSPNELFSGSINLVSNDYVWNIALYAGTDSGAVDFNWTSDRFNMLRMFTPYKETEVGISQRHNGSWT